MKAWKGLAAIKHKVVRPAGRLNPFPAFSRPDPFCPSNLFLVSSFVPQISLSGRGPSKEGVKICTMRAVTTALLLDEISRLWCVHVYIWCVHVYVQKLSGILFYWRSKQEEGRGKSVREQDRYQGIMAPHKIGNRPPFVKVSTNLKRHMFDTGLNIPYTLNITYFVLMEFTPWERVVHTVRVNSWKWEVGPIATDVRICILSSFHLCILSSWNRRILSNRFIRHNPRVIAAR